MQFRPGPSLLAAALTFCAASAMSSRVTMSMRDSPSMPSRWRCGKAGYFCGMAAVYTSFSRAGQPGSPTASGRSREGQSSFPSC